MKTIHILNLLLATHSMAAEPSLADPKTPAKKGYAVVFSDEFNGDTINPNKWKMGLNAPNVIQASHRSPFLAKNLSLKNGKLILTARKEPSPVFNKVYTSKQKQAFDYSAAGINTEGIFYLTGEFYVEIRCKFPENPGGYVAFWTMPAKSHIDPQLPIRDRHETDFFEFKTNKAKASSFRYFSSLWWHSVTPTEAASLPEGTTKKRPDNSFWLADRLYKLHRQETMPTPTVDFSKPITMGFKATKDNLSWHLTQQGTAYDSPAYMTFTGGTVHSRKNKTSKKINLSLDRPVPTFNNFLIFNYRIADDTWLGGPIDPQQLPATTEVDYIRVYRKP